MRIGLNYHGTIDKNFNLFKGLTHVWVNNGIEVYVIAALKNPIDPNRRKEIEHCKVMKTGVEIIPFQDYTEVPALKLRTCRLLGITLMFDHTENICQLLAQNGIATCQVR